MIRRSLRFIIALLVCVGFGVTAGLMPWGPGLETLREADVSVVVCMCVGWMLLPFVVGGLFSFLSMCRTQDTVDVPQYLRLEALMLGCDDMRGFCRRSTCCGLVSSATWLLTSFLCWNSIHPMTAAFGISAVGALLGLWLYDRVQPGLVRGQDDA